MSMPERFFVAGVVGVVLGAMVLSIQDYRAFDAETACRVKRMEPVRRRFSTHVVCVPINTRQDTTTVRINVGRDK